MYDPLALDRQRQDQDNLRRRAACGPASSAGPKPPREARRRHGVMRRLRTATSST
jgi:hypothetical protein